MNLIWQKYEDALFGEAYELVGLPSVDHCASARRHGKGYIAHASIGGRYLSHNARTLRSAMTRLQAEIDRLSISLFGVDDVTFELRP